VSALLLVLALHWAPFPVGEPVSHGYHLIVYADTPNEARSGCLTRMAQDFAPGEPVDCTAAPRWLAPYPDTEVTGWSS
jgi:hypothetical protein